MRKILNKQDLVAELRRRNYRLAPTQQAELTVPYGTRFDWQSLWADGWCEIPGLPRGQLRDMRLPTGSEDGLHVQFFQADARFHLDHRDACRDLLGHIVSDTSLVAGFALGALITACIDSRAQSVVAGALLGAFCGSLHPRRQFERDFHAQPIRSNHSRLSTKETL